MTQIIRMPEVLAGAAEAVIQTWLVASGAAVAAGDALAELETDKAVVEFQTEFSGTIGRLLAAEGDSVAVGAPIATLLADGETAEDADAALQEEEITSSEPQRADPAVPEPSETATKSPDSSPHGDEQTRLFASPLVRRLAAQQEVDLATLTGTGPRGRIVRRDLEDFLAQRAASNAAASTASPPKTGAGGSRNAAYQDIALDRMRKAIARRLTESKSTVPHFYLKADCSVDELLQLRARINAVAPRKVSVNDLVVKAVAGALADVPDANVIWNDDSVRRFSEADIAVAVATEGGLLTPVVRDAARLDIVELSGIVADLAERARAGRLRQHELEGGSFSVSNLGMYGTSEFSAILNPPQSGILAVGAARPTPVVGENGELRVSTVMTVTLSADHRVLDGAVAARWLAAFQRRIENPLSLLLQH